MNCDPSALVTVTCDGNVAPQLTYFSKKREINQSENIPIQIEEKKIAPISNLVPRIPQVTGEPVYALFNTGDKAKISCSTSIDSVLVQNGINCPGTVPATQTCNRCITSENIQKCEIITGKFEKILFLF